RVMCDDCTSGNYTFKEADCAEDYAPETVGVIAENEAAIQAFPNPVQTLMQIRLPAHWKATPDIIITNASGEQVQVPVTYKTQLVVCDMQQLPSGLYHIQMRAENEFARATCIVAH
ncbi:MAG TPA: T9SS type A sorting domain-containing protein, partial [Chitinophagales bacterium]|nr:T9SS type A sorting domain-containing protein [Chitinophagales bacterium]